MVWQEGGVAVTASTVQHPRLLVLHPAASSLLRAVGGDAAALLTIGEDR